MDTYIIETKGRDEYITSVEHGFILKVIPPERQDEDKEYTPYQVVAAIFEEHINGDPSGNEGDTAEMVEDWVCNEPGVYDFEGINISFMDDDVSTCNKELWLGAINYYCQLKLDKPVVGLLPYNYNYELGELDFLPEV